MFRLEADPILLVHVTVCCQAASGSGILLSTCVVFSINDGPLGLGFKAHLIRSRHQTPLQLSQSVVSHKSYNKIPGWMVHVCAVLYGQIVPLPWIRANNWLEMDIITGGGQRWSTVWFTVRLVKVLVDCFASVSCLNLKQRKNNNDQMVSFWCG